MGRVLHIGPSWHGPSFMWAELAWAELVLGRVVLHPDHIPTSPDYPRGGRSEIIWDLGGWSWSMTWPACNQFLAILQVCWHRLAGRANCFKHSDRLA